MEAISLSRNSQLGVKLAVSGGKSFQLASTLTTGLSLSGKISVNSQLGGQYQLVIKGAGSKALAISLYRQQDASQQQTLALGAAFGLSDLSAWADDLLAPIDNKASKLSELLNSWKNPGDKLATWLSQQQGSHAWAAITQALLADNPSAADAMLIQSAAGHLNQQLAVFSTDAAALAAVTSGKVANALGLSSDVAAAVEGLLAEGIGYLQTTFSAEVNSWLQQQGSHAFAVAKAALSQSKQAVNTLEKDGEENAAKLRAAIRYWLDDYQQLRSKVSSALAQSAKLRLGVNWQATRSAESQQQTMLSFTLNALTSAPSKDLFAALLAGAPLDLDTLASAQSQGVILGLDGWLHSQYQQSRSLGFTCQLLGFTLSQSRTFSDISQVKVAANGDLLLATSEVKLGDNASAFGESRSVGFVCSYDLARALLDNTPPSLGLSFAFSDEKGMDIKECQQLLAPLTQTTPPLLAASVYQQAQAWYQAKRQALGPQPSQIQAATALSPGQVQALLSASTEQWQQAGATVALAHLQQQRAYKKVLAQVVPEPPSSALTLLKRFDDAADSVASQYPQSTSKGKDFRRRVAFIRRTLKHIETLSTLPGSFAALKSQTAALKDEPQQLVAALNDIHQHMQSTLSHWLDCRGIISGWFTESLTEPMLELQQILALLVGASTPLLVPVITVGSGDTQQSQVFS